MKAEDLFKQDNTLLLDGGMGTMLQAAGLALGEKPEALNLKDPALIESIHARYAAVGSAILNANTFGASAHKLAGTGYTVEQVIAAGIGCAKRAAAPYGALVALDVGPLGELLEPSGTLAFEDAVEEYARIVRAGAAAGADLVFFETFTDLYELKAALLACKENCALPILASMSFEAGGRTFTGCTVESFAATARGLGADALGINCSLGPKEIFPMAQRLAAALPGDYPVFVKPNAGLPRADGSGYDVTSQLFAHQMKPYRALGLFAAGGCCGTTPAHIRALRQALEHTPMPIPGPAPAPKAGPDRADPAPADLFLRKLAEGKKVIAVELDSPKDADLTGYMDGARRLQRAGVDAVTIADCPIARARVDAALTACKLRRELGLVALPHMTCRDRNLNAAKALLLGLYAEGVREVLAITGDPIPTAERDEVKNVYQFNSRKLDQYILSLAGREMPGPMTVFGALNLNARNFGVELRRAQEKVACGMSGFLTQPILSETAVENLRQARETLGPGVRLLAGILPVVSQRNALFMENEVNGIHVAPEIIERYAGLDRAEGEALGLELSVEMARAALPFADGFYLMTPFNRVALMERLVARLKTEVIGE